MYIDYDNDQIILHEEANESFIVVQDHTVFTLCERIRNGNYQMPYVALPLVVTACKRAGYPIRYSSSLIDHHNSVKTKRKLLEDIKAGVYPTNHPDVAECASFIEFIQKERGFTLMPEQVESIIYGVIGKRILIANEIGTGKTLTVNTIEEFLYHTKRVRKTLVMVPAKLVKNFYNDYVRFYGSEGILSVSKELKVKRIELYKKFMSNDKIKILVTNYEKCNFDYDELKKFKLDMIVVDEFHMMKNFMKAERSKNFFAMIKDNWKPKYRFPMSGTPIENRLFDLFPIFKLLDGGQILGGQRFFEINFVEYEDRFYRIKKSVLRKETVAVGFKNHELLKGLIKPLVIRKKLKLPMGKYSNFIEIEIDKQTKEKYEWLKKNCSGSSARYHATRQFLCDPSREQITTNKKLEELQNILDQTSEKIVVFTFYHAGVEALSRYFDSIGLKYYKITGKEQGDPVKTLERFKNDKDARCLIGTDSINFGLNIQFCRFMVNYDIPLKPTTYDQRVGRLYRKGQENDVHIYNFYVADTVEEKIYEQFEAKKELINVMIENLDEDELNKLENEIEKEVMREFE